MLLGAIVPIFSELEGKLKKQLDTEKAQEYTQDELGFIEFILVREGLFAITNGSLEAKDYGSFSYRSQLDYSLKTVSIETVFNKLGIKYA